MMAKSNEKVNLIRALFDQGEYLKPESRKIYYNNLKVDITAAFIAVAIIIVLSVRRADSQAFNWAFFILAAGLCLRGLWLIYRGETLWQLRRRDVRTGKQEAKDMLNSMKKMGNGKK